LILMKKQLVSLLLLVAVLASTTVVLDSANSLSTVTTTFTSTYTTAVTKSTTVSTFYATYMQTDTITIPGWGPYHLVAGDKIVINGFKAKGTLVMIYDSWGRKADEFHFVSEGYEQKTFTVKPGKDGTYRIEYYWPGLMFASCPISITAYHTEAYWTTSSSFLVQQYVTSVLTEGTFTETETVTDWSDSTIAIVAILIVVATIIAIALMKRKPRPKQT